jgi:hypothetical protein
MKNYKRLRRIFEDATAAQADPQVTFEPMQPQSTAQVEPMQMPTPEPALPPVGGTSAAPDPMVMTVKDFLDKVKNLDPLVAMGIEAYIEKNMGSLIEPASASFPATPGVEPDLSFSSQVQAPAEPDLSFSSQAPTPAPAEPALDFPA